MPDYQHPLTQEHCDCLTKAIQSSNNTSQFLDACKRCGLPVDELIADNNRQREMAERLKREFFPNAP
jgi:hypothetical protein